MMNVCTSTATAGFKDFFTCGTFDLHELCRECVNGVCGGVETDSVLIKEFD